MIWSRRIIRKCGGHPLWSDSTKRFVETLEEIKARTEALIAGARLELMVNGSPSAQNSLLVDNAHAVAVSRFLRDDPRLRLDYASNVTAVDWLDTVVKKTVKVKQVVD